MAGSTLMRKRVARRKNNSIKAKLARLERKVASNTPELRQQSYIVTVAPGPGTQAATPLLAPTNIAGDEFKLHRIRVSHLVPASAEPGPDPQRPTWGQLYSPNVGYTADEGYPTTSRYGDEGYMWDLDRTKQRVWTKKTEKQHDEQRELAATSTFFFDLDKRFGIPMICGTTDDDEENPTVVRNQIYYTGSNFSDSGIRDLYVTIWYTDA